MSVFGLGYVGCVSVACLAQGGHRVIGVDVQESKVALLRQGLPTIVEPGLDAILLDAHTRGSIDAITSVDEAVRDSEILLITVGTPSRPDGELDLSHIYSVAEDIGRSLKRVEGYRAIAIRSTIKPGTTRRVIDIIGQQSGKLSGHDFSVVSNPEFLREGTAIKDYLNPPYVLIGAEDDRGVDEVASIYNNVQAEIIRVRLETAEIIKYVNNSWHALKVAFANEVGSVCQALEINSREVSDIFVRDRVLNISPVYLRPGFAYGGACLPKDLSGFVSLARSANVATPVLDSVAASNERHIDRAIETIRRQGVQRIGVLGLSFKAGTDDIRNSPALRLVRALVTDGFDVRVFDEAVYFLLASGRSVPSYRAALGEVDQLLVETPGELLAHAELVIVAKKDRSFEPILRGLAGRRLVDLVNMETA